ncbi:DoxX family protein [Brumimicrobium aurantiacum]|uniref:DoxX family protein n=1 Tax=Brumimicrobium aurantiacum TaxID=1737063 RepID=A0A3E1EZ50_9FLAO|nr:DoxX family protein [Brumimicrobium aurantiacum]RFC54737.1 DoxX family protein [Brumimicrobium aurantiacum]
MSNLNKIIGVFTLRMLLGLIFLMQGFGKIFSWGMDNVINAPFFKGTFEDILPAYLINITAYYTSYIELIGGALLVLGLKTNYALYALASVLIIVTFGHGLAEPIWDLSHVMYRTILLVALLMIPRTWDKLSIDYLIEKK